MAKITKEQVKSINSKCRNGFYFNVKEFLMRGKKELEKMIIVNEDEKVVKIQLYWVNDNSHRNNDYEKSTPHCTKNVIPQIYLTVWTKKKLDACWHCGMSWRYSFFEYPCDKPLLNKLYEVAEQITDDLICSLLPEDEHELITIITKHKGNIMQEDFKLELKNLLKKYNAKIRIDYSYDEYEEDTIGFEEKTTGHYLFESKGYQVSEEDIL